MKKYVFSPFQTFQKVLDGLFTIIDALDFLNFLNEFKICYATPKFKWKKKCKRVAGAKVCIKIPKVSFSNKKCYGLEDIGKALGLIEKAIKSIPGVGNLWTACENLFQKALQALFKEIGIELPDFGLNLNFVDDIVQDLEEAKEKLLGIVIFFEDIVLLGGDLSDRAMEAFESLTKLVPDALINFNCTSPECLQEILGIGIDIDASIPTISVGDVKISIPEELLDIPDQILGVLGDIKDEFDALFESEISCGKYTTTPVNITQYMRAGFNVSTADLGIPDCPVTFELCTDLVLPDFDTFLDRVQGYLAHAISKFRQRRLEDSCVNCPSDFGFVIPIPISELALKKLGNVIMKQGNRVRPKDIDTKIGLSKKQYYVLAKGLLNEKIDKFKCDPGMGDFCVHVPNVGSMYMKFFDGIAANLVIGSDGTNGFQAKVKIGSFFDVGFTKQFKYRSTTTSKGSLTTEGLTNFTDQANRVEEAGKMLCKLDHIYATREVFREVFAGDFNQTNEIQSTVR
eukprot:scaffold104369_cov24-Attheya_sp.AAC.1